MAIYPYRFSSDQSLGPVKPKIKKKRGVSSMACKTTKKKSSAKKSSSKKKPCC